LGSTIIGNICECFSFRKFLVNAALTALRRTTVGGRRIQLFSASGRRRGEQSSKLISSEMRQDFIGGWQVRKGLANLPPTLNALAIHEQSGIERDVLTAPTGVHKAILANDPGTRIRKHGKVPGEHLFPKLPGISAIINADREHLDAKPVELPIMPRELAQFSDAIRSPVTAIKNQQHRMRAQTAELHRDPQLITESEIGCRLAGGRGDLRGRQSLLRACRAPKKCVNTHDAQH
jgi:hypothetical protein